MVILLIFFNLKNGKLLRFLFHNLYLQQEESNVFKTGKTCQFFLTIRECSSSQIVIKAFIVLTLR